MKSFTVLVVLISLFCGLVQGGEIVRDPGTLAQNVNPFGCDLYGKLSQGPQNVFLSPLSLSSALTMTALGARGETLAEMVRVLHLPGSIEVAAPGFGTLTRALSAPDQGYIFTDANALWGQQGYPFRADYIKVVHDSFDSSFQSVDFVRETETTRRRINQWTEDHTQEKIKDLLPLGVLDTMTLLVLTNAVYFKGTWQSPFEVSVTRDGDFWVTPGTSKKVPLMHQVSSISYGEDDTSQIIDLPYQGDRISMTFVLPRQKDGLGALEQNLTATKLETRLSGMTSQRVDLTIPRFKVTAEFMLGTILESMGMRKAFSDRADFSGMQSGGDPLQISAVIHKAFVDLNEAGTEAAAATAVVMRSLSLMPLPEVTFRADHPFLFLIRDRKSGVILFMGRLVSP